MNLDESLAAMHAGEALLVTAMADVDPLTAPTLLPDWSRAHLLAHLGGNATALTNLLHWASTGIETPMYSSTEARNADIEHWSKADPKALLGYVTGTRDRLRDAIDATPAAAWGVQVRSASGRTIEAAEVPWMRVREVYIHAVDLGTGVTFQDITEDVRIGVIDEVTVSLSAKPNCPNVWLLAGDNGWQLGDPALNASEATVVEGGTAELLAWLVGRSAGTDLTSAAPIPALPRWL
jgi:maleylpyruvate isomerase